MKKTLLFAAAMAIAATAPAQNYTAQATTYVEEDWTGYDGNIMLDKTVTVESYDDYVIVKSWLGDNQQDLKITFDEEDNVTSLTPITSGVEGKTYKSGYASFNTKASNYYYVQLYLGEGYDYAYSDNAGGYVMLSGYFYENSDNYLWMYYYISWGTEQEDLGELNYTTDAETSVYEDWGAADKFFAPGTKVGVDVYENGIILKNWCGAEGYNLTVTFNDDATVTSLAATGGENTGEIFDDGKTMAAYTGNAELYYVNIYVAEGYNYAYSSADDNYVLLNCTFYDTNDDEHALYYYVSWTPGENGVNAIITEAPAEYYNLQGQPVGTPAKGQIVIKRQGNTATKQIIR